MFKDNAHYVILYVYIMLYVYCTHRVEIETNILKIVVFNKRKCNCLMIKCFIEGFDEERTGPRSISSNWRPRTSWPSLAYRSIHTGCSASSKKLISS